MKRREFLKTTAAAGLMTVSPFTYASEKQTDRPNIIYIMADDLGYGDLGCYGQKLVQTPNIDRLAQEGMLFTQHYSGSTVCAPSRCSLMTGYHTGHTFIRGNKEIKPEGQFPIPKDTYTVAKLMKNAGYKTGIVGKWGLGAPDSDGAPNKQGFDYWFGVNCQRQAHRFYPTHLWENTTKIELGGKKYSHDLMTEKALKFLDDSKDAPFFLYLPYTIPHAELNVPEDSMKPYRGKFKEKSFPGAGNYGATDEPRAAFAGMVSRMDRDVGRIVSKLKKLGLDNNTLILFTSDNGPHKEGGHDPEYFNSNGPLRGVKRDLYEGGIRVPMIARWPKSIKPGTKCDHISAFWDFMPTCAELAGAKIPKGIDGISYAPVLSGKPEKQQTHEYMYWEFHERGLTQAVRMGDWKAFRPGKGKPLELYNLKDDIGEQNNIADKHPKIIAKIENYIKSARTESEIFPVK
jgi:arylsulfatase A-like enzyme